MVQIYDEGNIDKMDYKIFPMIIFLLAIANMVPATVSSIFYSPNFSQCQFINIFLHQNFSLYSNLWSNFEDITTVNYYFRRAMIVHLIKNYLYH